MKKLLENGPFEFRLLSFDPTAATNKKTMEQKEPENSFVNIVKRNLKPIEPKKQSIPINIRKLSTLRDIDERQISTPNESIEEQEEFDDDSSNDNREYDDNE